MPRDRDIRNAIQQALLDTNMFDAVHMTGLPEDWGFGASELAAAAIEPGNETDDDKWDASPYGDLLETALVTITFAQRMDDPQLCDEAVELLFDVAANALNGSNFGGFTVPGLTKFKSRRWEKRKHPERRITAVFTYQTIIPGWNAYGTEQ